MITTASEVQSFTVTIPAGTKITDGFTKPLAMPPRIVDRIDILVPPGPRGEMGFRLGSSGTAVIPHNEGEWIVTDNELIKWPLTDQIDSGAWELFAYNNGLFDHTVQIRFMVKPTTDGSQGTAQRQPISL